MTTRRRPDAPPDNSIRGQALFHRAGSPRPAGPTGAAAGGDHPAWPASVHEEADYQLRRPRHGDAIRLGTLPGSYLIGVAWDDRRPLVPRCNRYPIDWYLEDEFRDLLTAIMERAA